MGQSVNLLKTAVLLDVTPYSLVNRHI